MRLAGLAIPLTLSVGAGVISILVVLGWVFQIDFLTHFGGLSPMQLGNALMMLAGVVAQLASRSSAFWPFFGGLCCAVYLGASCVRITGPIHWLRNTW